MSAGVNNFLSGFITGTIFTAIAFSLYNDIRLPWKIHVEAAISENNELTKYLQKNEVLKYGVPDRGPDVRLYTNHALCYDQAKKIPLWVAEILTKSYLKGPAKRNYSHFQADPTLDPFFSSAASDFKHSRWTKGHLAPAGNYKFSQDATDETFYLSNVVPQDFSNNSGFWNRLEMYCRTLTEKFPHVRVFSGPLMMAYADERRKKKFVKYQVIGDNRVAVPTHLFKVIAADVHPLTGGSVAIGAFIVPNRRIDGHAELTRYKVRLESLEKLSGVHFLPELPLSKRKDLCTIDSCKL